MGDCNILQSENGLPCSMDLIERMVLQGLCFSNGVDSYVCNVNSNYTGDPPCCVSHFSDGRNSSYCGPSSTTEAVSTQDTTDLIGQDTSPTASTVPNVNSTADIPDPPMKDDNDPYIPAYCVAGIITLIIVVVAVVFSVWWCYRTCKPGRRRSVPPSVCGDKQNPGGGQNPPNQENPTVVIPMENRGAAGAGGIDTDGHRQSSPSQENPQDASQGGSQVPATTNTKQSSSEFPRRRRKPLTTYEETRRRPPQPRQEVTEPEKELKSSTRTVPFSKESGYTSESVMIQPFSDNYEPPDDLTIQEDTSSSSASQASDDGSPYVPLPLKSSSLVRKLNNKDLVTAHMSHLECKDDIQEKPSITPVVQGHMQSLDQDDPEAEALVVQQKVKVGEDTSSAVAHKQRSCFKSGGTDDETRGSVSRKDPLKKHKFPPAHLGTVGVAITCALILATFMCHGRGYTSHPSFASKYRWLDRGTPWIRALADRLTYPQNLGPAAYCGIFPMTLTTLISLYDQCQHKTADPTLNDQAYNYQWLDRGTWIGAIAYPLMFGSPNLRLAVYCGIILTTMALIIMATTLISLFDQYQPGPICAPSGVRHCVSLAAIKSCRWTGIAPHVNLPAHQIAAVLIVG
ncbi:uncharacterized protein LOC135345844 [Halichondria panicea]|uniref:uncharacterized protein LOC135345844 n=1 Tax=Halichondria panicea TaxID=6063 RepID=UPI00312B2D8E